MKLIITQFPCHNVNYIARHCNANTAESAVIKLPTMDVEFLGIPTAPTAYLLEADRP